MSYPKSLKERAIQLAQDKLSAEQIAAIFSKEVESKKHDYEPTPKTIRKWLSEAREQERIQPLVDRAIDEHLDEIRSLIEEWKVCLITPQIDRIYPGTSSPTHDVETHRLFKCLMGHLPDHTFWENHRKYTERITKYLAGCKRLREKIKEEVESWPNVQRVTSHAAQPILSRLSGRVVSEKPSAYRFDSTVTSSSTLETLVVDNSNVLEARNVLGYKESYKKLNTHILGSKRAVSLITLFNDLKCLEPKIKEYLEEVLLSRDYVMNRCKLCPGQPRQSR